MHPFGHGHLEQIGGDYVSVNVACLDDFDPAELATIPIRYFDGRNNAWESEPAHTQHM